jgi:para-nitrobenzyl esterase
MQVPADHQFVPWLGTPRVRESDTMSLADLDLQAATDRLMALYGENRPITDDDYDKSCAVRCVNGTFVGKRTDDSVIAFKGIPFVGEQPSGDLRWKRPVDYVADDGVYEAYYFGRIPHQWGNAGQIGSPYPKSEECSS